MSQTTIAQERTNKGSLTFIDYHRPAIEAGTYKLTAKQHLNSPDGAESETNLAEQPFIVATPRFELPPGTIHAHYPPLGGNADYDGIVPSISFNRPTLPWERSPDEDNDTPDGASWLALILVDGQDFSDARIREASQSDDSQTRLTVAQVQGQLGIQNLESWELYRPEQAVNVLELTPAFYEKVLPAYGDLQWLSHTRKAKNEAGESTGELTYVLGNRLPTPNQVNTVYLVSLEHRYADTQADTQATLQSAADGYQRLVYLHKWTFFCKPGILYNYVVTEAILLRAKDQFAATRLPETPPDWVGEEFEGLPGREDLRSLLLQENPDYTISEQAADWILKKAKRAGGTFDGLLDAVEAGSFHERARPGRPVQHETARQLLASGRTVLRHHLRSGGKTYSWYKGPLSPHREADLGFPFPVPASDALLIFNQATGMLDTTYATAWNLGRLKGLENKGIATSLYRWRHNQRQVLMQKNHELDHGHLHVVNPQSAQLPDDVMQKIEAWKRLQDIPFNYLVPKASLLPEESLRFFHLDPNWVRALLDGFFSVGKVHGLDDKGEEYEHFPRFDHPVTGILLRSDAVAGWPSLHVDAHAQRFEGTDFDIDPRHQIPVLRKTFLNNEVLLMLFDGIPKTIDVYLSPEALHSGFTPHMTDGDEDVSYVHPICNPDTGEDIYEGEEAVTVTAIAEENQNEYRIFYPSKVAERMQAAIRTHVADHDTFTLTPGRFGLELIEGTPMVRFQLAEMEFGQVMAPSTRPDITPSPPPPEDDLTQITGIGEAYSNALKAAGYTTFSSIARETPAALQAALVEISSSYSRVDTSTWPAQAEALMVPARSV